MLKEVAPIECSSMTSELITVSLYQHSVPLFVDSKLNDLYQHLHSSLAFQSLYGNLTSETNTYVVRKNEEVTTVLLFNVEKKKVRVLNEQFHITAEEADRFARYIFNAYHAVTTISFPVAAMDETRGLTFPYQKPHCTHDIVLDMPETVEAYMTNLGKSTRNYVKRYLNKLKRSFPSFLFKTYAGEEASNDDIRAIIALNRARMAGRHKESYIDENEEERIIKLVRLCGLVTVGSINGKVCAGAINFRIGQNYFLKVIAHDPAYDEYGLGTLCCYLTICECIKQKGKKYHFLWGRYEYKYRLLGVQRDLSHLVIYRSKLQALLSAAAACKLAYKGYAYDINDWLEHKARRRDSSSLTGRLAYYCLNYLKRLKRSASRTWARSGDPARLSRPLQKE